MLAVAGISVSPLGQTGATQTLGLGGKLVAVALLAGAIGLFFKHALSQPVALVASALLFLSGALSSLSYRQLALLPKPGVAMALGAYLALRVVLARPGALRLRPRAPENVE